MSLHTSRRRSLSAALTVVAASALVAGGTATALADPASLDDRTLSCAALLQQATTWPGGDDPSHVSIAYDLYLSTQPECTSPRA